MAEWSIAMVLKTIEVQASGGSNPSLSARILHESMRARRTSVPLILWCARVLAESFLQNLQQVRLLLFSERPERLVAEQGP